MTFLKKHWQLAAALAVIAFMFFFGWRLNSQSVRAVELGLFILLGVALLLMPVTSLAERILSKLGENAAVAVKNVPYIESVGTSWSRERTHRQDLELAMVSRLHDALAIVPEAGDNAKKMLDRLLAQDGPPTPSPDEQVAERALRQVLSIVQRYLPPDGVSIDDAMSQIIALVDPFPVRSTAGEAAKPATAGLSDDLLSSASYGKASCGDCKKGDTIKLPVVDPATLLESKRALGDSPRVTKKDIEAEIFSEHYFVGSDAIQQANAVHVFGDAGWYLGSTQRMTFCVLQLKNGFAVTGESACVSPENFDAQIGRDIARDNAIEKMWLLLGFRLADKVHSDLDTPAERG